MRWGKERIFGRRYFGAVIFDSDSFGMYYHLGD